MKKIFLVLIVLVVFLCSCTQINNDLSMGASLTIKCDTILKNTDKLSSEKRDIIPKDGIILLADNVKFGEGESLLDILKRELKANKIHIDFEPSTAVGSAYVKGIANIYSGDCGELSGWMIRVNGEDLTVGADSYFPKDGDSIEWIYTCDMGNDL